MTTSFKTKDEEIQYLSSMISATRKEDTERLKTIGLRLIELAVIHNNSIEPLTSRITEFDNIIRSVCTELGIIYAGVDIDNSEIIEAIKALKGNVVFIKSVTTGNKLPARIIKKSLLRNLFFLPSILVEYQGTGLKGIEIYTTWMRKTDIFE